MPISSTHASSLAASKINNAASALNSKNVNATEPRAALDFFECCHQFFGVRQAVVDADAFAVVAQVRRGKGTDLEARGRLGWPRNRR